MQWSHPVGFMSVSRPGRRDDCMSVGPPSRKISLRAWQTGWMTDDVVYIDEKFALFSALWSPKLVPRLNDFEVKVVRLKGEFVWHTHEDTDELFLVVDGQLTIQRRDRDVLLGPGQPFVVPRGVEHCPRADHEVKALLLESAGTVNTGDAGGELTAVVESI